jgi:hypothetical protein
VKNSLKSYSKGILLHHTVMRFVRVSTKLGNCTVVSVNVTPVEEKMCTFIPLNQRILSLTSAPYTVLYTHDGASAKFSTNSHGTDYSAGLMSACTRGIAYIVRLYPSISPILIFFLNLPNYELYLAIT